MSDGNRCQTALGQAAGLPVGNIGVLVGDATLARPRFYGRLQAELVAVQASTALLRGCGRRTMRRGAVVRRCCQDATSTCCWSTTSRASTAMRGLKWRCADGLSLREFLRLGERERVPDHSRLSHTLARAA